MSYFNKLSKKIEMNLLLLKTDIKLPPLIVAEV